MLAFTFCSLTNWVRIQKKISFRNLRCQFFKHLINGQSENLIKILTICLISKFMKKFKKLFSYITFVGRDSLVQSKCLLHE